MKVAAALSTMAALSAHAADDLASMPPVERYRTAGQYAMLMCPTAPDKAACVSSGLRDGKTHFDQALRTLKKPAARNALKAYHAAYVTALQGVQPGPDETRITYAARQRSLGDSVTAAWAKFELER